jgi:probable rRNA maturation factor
MPVEIVNLQKKVKVPTRKLRAAVEHTIREELGRDVCVNVAIVTDEKIAELNEDFLERKGPTDVLAFPFGEDEAVDEPDRLFGEIVISADRARAEAKARRIDVAQELVLYAVHGMLHLAGYDDLTAKEAGKMHAREVRILRDLGFTVEDATA